ncbi:iron-containing alcohol dehydrogenase [Gemmobacter fulvus]|uniref:iron-containing alcohol dehydrogenase n=1 Tax=Gemmobacter fulvus TaxID=2840474 RepID=UPI0027965064|nr:iron-containing alcohol dehydrogenase [Gemmobacter fulvus]MDQ1847401.1 iron-containing alcohol dehydrogenase [Gemmobacter fulvus]
MNSFSIAVPGRILFGRGEAAKAPGLIAAFGVRGIVVHGADAARAGWLMQGLRAAGCEALGIACAGEPVLAVLEQAVAQARAHRPDWIVALGGGAALDLGKAIAALVPAPGEAMDYLEVVGRGLPLEAAPLPFIALPSTAGTGAEVTKNAVIGVPAQGRKVSLRDDRMLARLAIVDPALTDDCPRAVTLASGLDAITQVIEPYISCKATPYTDAITRPVIGPGLAALVTLMAGEDAQARDTLAWTSVCGGMALANAGLGAVHGLAGVIGGQTGAAHGAICGVLLGPVLAMNRARTDGQARARIDEVCALISGVLGGAAADAPQVLADWARTAGLPGLAAQGLAPADHAQVAEASAASSSMKGNPVPLPPADLVTVLQAAR